MKRFFTAFKPTLADGALQILALLVIVVMAIPELLSQFFVNRTYNDQVPFNELAVVFFSLLPLAVPISAALGTYSATKLKDFRWFVILVPASFLLLLAILYRENFLQTDATRPLSSPYLLPMIGCVVLTSIGTWGLTKISIWVTEKHIAISGQQLLIIFAILMFVVLTIRNVLGTSLESVPTRGIRSFGQLLYVFGLCSIFLGVIPAVFLREIRGAKAILLAIAYYPFLAAAGGYTTPTIYDFNTVFVPTLLFGILSFVTIALLTSKPKRPGEHNTRWSVYGWMLVVAITGLIAVGLNFSLLAVVNSNINNTLKIARDIKRLSTTPGIQARLETWTNSQTIYGQIAYDDDCDRDVLKSLDQSKLNFWAWHYQMNPNVDTSYIRDAPKRAGALNDSTVTMEQVSDICNTGTNLYVTNCKIVTSDNSPKSPVTVAPTIQLAEMEEGEIANFLKRVDTTLTSSILITSCVSISSEDWESILNTSRVCKVQVFHEAPSAVISLAVNSQHRTNLQFNFLPSRQTRDYWRLVLDTSIIPIPVHHNNEDSRHFWDLAFATKADLTGSFDLARPKATMDNFEAQARNLHWLFDTPSGKQTGLIVPIQDELQIIELVESVSSLPELTQLSFGVHWIPSLCKVTPPLQFGPNDLSLLGNLTKMKRLHFPINFSVADIAFVKHMPELEHLQIDVRKWNRNQLKNYGLVASDLGNLKSLVIVGQPSKFVAAEISKLPSLKKLTIVLDKTELVSQLTDKIEERLSLNFKPNYLLETTFFPPASPEFEQHIKGIRKKLRRIHLK